MTYWATFNSELAKSKLAIEARENEGNDGGRRRKEDAEETIMVPSALVLRQTYAPAVKFNVASVVVDEPSTLV